MGGSEWYHQCLVLLEWTKLICILATIFCLPSCYGEKRHPHCFLYGLYIPAEETEEWINENNMVTTLAKNEFKHPILEHRFYQHKTDHKRQRSSL